MQSRPPAPWKSWLLAAAVLLVALAPWWRNHRYLRDFYDYGLVMAGVGRIGAGERPYVDFVTPIQTGIFLFNGWAEKLGDGSFQAMTHGAAALTVIGVGLMFGIFSRRWSAGVATALAVALAAMILTQHTIVWHNPVGALAIAVTACCAAVAPVWRREQWPWHLLTVLALVLGGITKLNSHLVATGSVAAWALYAGFQRRAAWARVGATLAGVAVAAFLVPLAGELAWTGASLREWWYNVIALPFGSRSGEFAAALHWKFYFAVRHDYYGTLPVPQLGALGMLATATFAVAAVRTLGRSQAGWVIAAALFAAGSGAGLLATNYEIAYLAMGAWFALLAALWLGFGLRDSGPAFHGGLVLPALLVGALAWHSAWQGQRSQFGYSRSPRTDYVSGETIAPDYGYLRGTFLPPETALSMEAAARWRASLAPAARRAVFYGPGLEWLERPWPTLKLPGMPLWMHGGTSYGPVEDRRLLELLSGAGPYRQVLVPEARDYWQEAAKSELNQKYFQRRLGPVWFHYEKLRPGIVSWRPLEFMRPFGGNVNSTQLESLMAVQRLSDGRSFLGVSEGAGEMKVLAPSYRAKAEAVLKTGPAPDGATTNGARVRFEVFSEAGGNYYPRWSAEVPVPADGAETILPFPLDCGGCPLRFLVTVPPVLAGRVTAGWRAITILHSVDGPSVPGMINVETREPELAGAAVRAALLPADWGPVEIYLRDCRLGAQGLEILPGGEIWIRLNGLYSELNGVATSAAVPALPNAPVLRVLFCKGPKLDVLCESALHEPDRRFEFKAWSAESDGWLVLAVDPSVTAPAVTVRLTSVRSAN